MNDGKMDFFWGKGGGFASRVTVRHVNSTLLRKRPFFFFFLFLFFFFFLLVVSSGGTNRKGRRARDPW